MLCPGADQRVALSMLGVLVLLVLGAGWLTVSGFFSSAIAAGLHKLHNVEEVILPILGKATSADWINAFSFGIAAGVVVETRYFFFFFFIGGSGTSRPLTPRRASAMRALFLKEAASASFDRQCWS